MPQLSYTTHGEGPCLVLLHAFPLDGRLFKAQLTLSGSRRLIIPDLRGFGRSRGLGPPSSIEQMADDVRGLLDELSVERASVLGVSMGGYIAQALAQKSPGRVERLLLCDTRAAADGPEAKQGRARQLAVLHGGGGVAALFEQLLPRLVGPTAGEAVRETLRQIALDQSQKSVSGAVVALRDRPDYSAALSSLRCPTLVLAGSDDVISPPAEGQAMADVIPQGVFAEIAGAGHLACIEAPEAFNRTVDAWLRDAL